MERKRHKSAVCLNCGETLKGQYCHKCGQDNLDHQDTIWHLARHFFEDITHYDGKLWKTVKPLLTRPGFLTQEYLQGKRVSYLNPVRLFIFLNFIFFFLLLSMPSLKSHETTTEPVSIGGSNVIPASLPESFKSTDSAVNQDILLDKHIHVRSGISYNTLSEYDSAQRAKPPGERDGFIERRIVESWINTMQLIKKDPHFVEDKINEVFLHNAPKLTFLFIITCSLLLYLLYYRKHLFMLSHALFSIHLACTFLLLSIAMFIASYLPLGDYIVIVLFLYGNYYFFRSLRVVYGQAFIKTGFKFIIINFSLLIAMSLGLFLNALFAMMSLNA